MKVPNQLITLVDKVNTNTSERFNCPSCFGYKTLGITKTNGKVVWNCFRVGCELRAGTDSYLAPVNQLRGLKEARTDVKEVFTTPDYLTYGISSENTLKMLISNNCYESYKKGLFEVAYDPQQHRVCFLIKKDGKTVGMVGRAVDSKTKPKVLNYVNSDIYTPFECGKSATVVLVEDCFSAASVTRIDTLSGLCLLGTNLKSEYIPSLKKYSTVIVALDRDARKKALAIKRKLCYYHSNVHLWLLDKDIKNMTDEELHNSFGKVILYENNTSYPLCSS